MTKTKRKTKETQEGRKTKRGREREREGTKRSLNTIQPTNSLFSVLFFFSFSFLTVSILQRSEWSLGGEGPHRQLNRHLEGHLHHCIRRRRKRVLLLIPPGIPPLSTSLPLFLFYFIFCFVFNIFLLLIMHIEMGYDLHLPW